MVNMYSMGMMGGMYGMYGMYNTYDEFCKIFDYIGKELGKEALDNFHAHIAGIEYSVKGEKKHLMLKKY